MISNACVIMLVKNPEPGTVKTRIAATLGHGFAASLYRAFVEDLLVMLELLPYTLIIAYYPSSERDTVTAWLGLRYHLLPQEGADLGERMASAMRAGFSLGYEKVILIGSDSPDLQPDLLTGALNGLDENDAVLGPSADGGYYLIGFRRTAFAPQVFQYMHWSTAEVYERTRSRILAAGLTLHTLPVWRDLDTDADLRSFYVNHSGTPSGTSATMRILHTIRGKLE